MRSCLSGIANPKASLTREPKDRVCGLDVHKDSIKACVRVRGQGKNRDQHIATFGTNTVDLLALRDWLEQWQVTDVAMESTGEYWKPIYYILEDRFHVLLANAAHIENVPGRKTDAKDGAWIAQLLECGLVAKSFVPPKEIREIRDLTRYRETCIQQRTEEVLRLHGVLQRAGIKLSSVASNIMGVSGRPILNALVAGQKDPEAMAALARGKLRGKIPLLKRALEGYGYGATSHIGGAYVGAHRLSGGGDSGIMQRVGSTADSL